MASPAPRLTLATRVAAHARAHLPAAWARQIDRLDYDDAGHGYDPLGLHPDAIAAGTQFFRVLYERYFRVQSSGIANIPARGPAILASNHGGALPFDAGMIYLDVLRRSAPPRVVRPVMDHFVPNLPFVSTFFARIGAIGGSRGNVRYALERGELLLIFPEGTAGIGKPIWRRYQLQEWHVGHVELAIRHRAPVIPVAVIGAEEQLPQIGRIPGQIRGLSRLGIPFLPLVLSPVPLPVRYRIYYGEAVDLSARYGPGDADDPGAVQDAAAEVKAAVAALIARGLAAREGIFR